MKIVEPSYEILFAHPSMDITRMAEGARTCFKTPYKSFEDDKRIVSNCFDRNEGSVTEHSSVTVKFICDRGVSHELVRHRLASFSQESTRYCNYSKDKFGNEISVVKPVMLNRSTVEYYIWEDACKKAEKKYFALLEAGVLPETARAVLPTCLKTEIVVTTNLREWYHILDLRTSRYAHPDIRYLMYGLLLDMESQFPDMFSMLAMERTPEIIKDFKNVKEG